MKHWRHFSLAPCRNFSTCLMVSVCNSTVPPPFVFSTSMKFGATQTKFGAFKNYPVDRTLSCFVFLFLCELWWMRKAVSESARWRLWSGARHLEGAPHSSHQRAQPRGRPNPSVVLIIFLIACGSYGSYKRSFKMSMPRATK